MFTQILQTLMAWGLSRKTIPFAYVIKSLRDGSPYITRLLFPKFIFRPMLHHIHQPDTDRAPHNHPWKWSISFILKGSYLEARYRWLDDGSVEIKYRTVRWINFIRDNDYHQIIKLNGDVWSFFCAGRRTQSWGFKDIHTGEYTDHQIYLGLDGASAKAK